MKQKNYSMMTFVKKLDNILKVWNLGVSESKIIDNTIER